jgi:hypothetical protein
MKQVSAFVRRADCHPTPLRRAVVRLQCWRCGLPGSCVYRGDRLCSWRRRCGYWGAWFGGALLIFIFAPAGYGQHVALGMAIRYAEGEK